MRKSKVRLAARALAVFVLNSVILSCAIAATPLSTITIDIQSIDALKKRYPVVTTTVDDPVYNRKQRYEGILLSDLIKQLTSTKIPSGELYLRFRCVDGYLPIMPLARASTGKAVVAFRDLNAGPGKDWQTFASTNGPQTPAPSYIVWESPSPADPDIYPWPYRMVAIELITAADAMGELSAASTALQGRDAFLQHCFKCHRINGAGGTMGPELNTPCSVTEYWDHAALKRFIIKPESVRAGAKMPPFPTLPEADVDHIIEFLNAMAKQRSLLHACR
jgi:mono/diheme cytochrome c family protein